MCTGATGFHSHPTEVVGEFVAASDATECCTAIHAGGELGIAAAPAGREPPCQPYVMPLVLAQEGLRWLI